LGGGGGAPRDWILRGESWRSKTGTNIQVFRGTAIQRRGWEGHVKGDGLPMESGGRLVILVQPCNVGGNGAKMVVSGRGLKRRENREAARKSERGSSPNKILIQYTVVSKRERLGKNHKKKMLVLHSSPTLGKVLTNPAKTKGFGCSSTIKDS